MSEIVMSSALLLKDVGYKKRRYGFNHHMPDGVVSVVHFWMAPFEPPAWTEVPGLRERRYGGFRLDFGVWVPEMGRMGRPKSEWINEYNCQLRATIGQVTGANDFWWKLADVEAATKAQVALREHGLPWLDRFPSKEAIFTAFEELVALGIGMSPAGGLDIADMYVGLGRESDARRTLERYVERPVLINHASYLKEYLVERGHEDLVTRIQTRA